MVRCLFHPLLKTIQISPPLSFQEPRLGERRREDGPQDVVYVSQHDCERQNQRNHREREREQENEEEDEAACVEAQKHAFAKHRHCYFKSYHTNPLQIPHSIANITKHT